MRSPLARTVAHKNTRATLILQHILKLYLTSCSISSLVFGANAEISYARENNALFDQRLISTNVNINIKQDATQNLAAGSNYMDKVIIPDTEANINKLQTSAPADTSVAGEAAPSSNGDEYYSMSEDMNLHNPELSGSWVRGGDYELTEGVSCTEVPDAEDLIAGVASGVQYSNNGTNLHVAFPVK